MLLFITLTFLGDKNPELTNIPAAYLDDFKQLKVDLSQKNYERSLPTIEALLQQSKKLESTTVVWLYEKQAEIHAEKYHFHFAIESFNKAKALSRKKNNYQQKIAHYTDYIERNQTERKLRKSYRDARNTGIAKTLKNNVTIAYFYLDDNRWSQWSNKDRIKNTQNVKQVLAWYKQQAAHYNVGELTFKTRYFFLRSPKGIGREWLRNPEFFDYTSTLLANQLGYESLDNFVESMRRHNPDNEVALVFHSNNEARSFASTCLKQRNSRCKFEYVMLTEKMNNSPTGWATTQTQSHEILHLFGAADLYNIEGAKNYAVTDVMNYYSKELKYASISPLTAWSIGWSTLPQTPFIVDEKKDY